MRLVQGLKQALGELDTIVTKYQAVARREAWIWNSFKCATKDLSPVRDKLNYYLTAIDTFENSLFREGTEKKLAELLTQVQNGQRSRSFIPSTERDNGPAWKELKHELVQDKIPKSYVARHKTAIIFFLLGCMSGSVIRNNVSLYDYISRYTPQNMEESSDEEPYCDESEFSYEYTSSSEYSHSEDDSYSDEDEYSDEHEYSNKRSIAKKTGLGMTIIAAIEKHVQLFTEL